MDDEKRMEDMTDWDVSVVERVRERREGNFEGWRRRVHEEREATHSGSSDERYLRRRPKSGIG